jgi:hypothetical protein
MSQSLRALWDQQVAYNHKVRAKEPESQLFWAKQYLLGLVAEVDEVLQELNWKSHRYGKPFNSYNFARELADIVKFSWCLWELYGYTSDDMLNFVKEKSDELDAQWQQDWKFSIPEEMPVLITDLDGTIGDWRKAFLLWLFNIHPEVLGKEVQDRGSTLAIEVDLNLSYPVYAALKEEFEANGGYKSLPFYADAIDVLQVLSQHPVCVIAYTARPAKKHGRIWSDTWEWIKSAGFDNLIKELRIGSEDRISRACVLQETGHKVLMLEDDPGLALRAANAGICVMLRSQPYNRGVRHELIESVDVFSATDILVYLKGSLYVNNQ